MSKAIDLKFEELSDLAPMVRLVSVVFSTAIEDKAFAINLELDQEAYSKAAAEYEKLLLTDFGKDGQKYLAAMKELPKAFHITLLIDGGNRKLSPMEGELFDPFGRILLNAAEIPYWTKGEAIGEFETVNPSSKWRIKSSDLTKSVYFERLDRPTGWKPT